IDYFFKCGSRLRTGQHDSVNEESRRTGHLGSRGIASIGIDIGSEFAAAEASFELPLREFQLTRVLKKGALIQLVRVVEKQVVILPELPLFSGTSCGLGGHMCLRMDLVQGIIAIGNFDFAFILFKQLFYNWERRAAKRALKIGE